MKFDEVIDYIKYADQWSETGKPVKPLKTYIESELNNQNSALFIALTTLPAKYKKELIMALISGNGERIHKILKDTGLSKLIISGCNAKLDKAVTFSDTALRRLAEHEEVTDKQYLNETVEKMIRVMIAPYKETRAEFLKDVIKSCPESQLGLKAKKKILKQIDKAAAVAVTDVAFESDAPNLSVADAKSDKKKDVMSQGVDKQRLTMFAKLLASRLNTVKPTLDQSQFILLVLGVLKEYDRGNLFIHKIENNYLFLNYETCLGYIEKIASEDNNFPLRSLILKQMDHLPKVNIERNQPRRYFETKLAQYYLGSQTTQPENKKSLNKIFKYYQTKYKIGITLSDKEDQDSLFADWPDDKIIEKAIMSITDSEKVVGRITRLQEVLLKHDSEKYKKKGREYSTGVISRKDLSRHSDTDPDTLGESEKILSKQVGLMKSSDFGYQDELSSGTSFNRSTDIHKYSKNQKAWPLQHPEVPYTASLSGHAYFIIGLLKEYMQDNKGDPDLSKDVNAFLMAVMATYIKQGLHSFFEMLAVFEEDHVKKYFQNYKVDVSHLRAMIERDVIASAAQHATQYAFDLNIKQLMHTELLSKTALVAPNNETHRDEDPKAEKIRLLKINFIKELVAYKDRRLFEKKKEAEPRPKFDLSTLFTSLKSSIGTDFDADIKVSATNKMITLLEGKKLSKPFTEIELAALRQKRLGDIVKKFEAMNCLPDEFVEAERRIARREYFYITKI